MQALIRPNFAESEKVSSLTWQFCTSNDGNKVNTFEGQIVQVSMSNGYSYKVSHSSVANPTLIGKHNT